MLSYVVNLETSFNKQQIKELVKPYYALICQEVYLINKQVRSCCWLGFPDQLIPYIENKLLKLLQLYDLFYYILPFDLMIDNIIKDHIQIFIYKYPWQRQLFTQYINNRDTITGDFIFGKLFGYSDEAINQFFVKNHINK